MLQNGSPLTGEQICGCPMVVTALVSNTKNSLWALSVLWSLSLIFGMGAMEFAKARLGSVASDEGN